LPIYFAGADMSATAIRYAQQRALQGNVGVDFFRLDVLNAPLPTDYDVITRLGYMLACLGTHVLTSSPVVHEDGPQSVRAAFTIPEARQLAEQAGWNEPAIAWHWPCRFLLQSRRPT
jgi:hypothetical protein